LSLEVVFETHSVSTDNERGIATGWLPGELSEDGRRLAARLGERRRDEGFASVFTSDLRRAVETAEIAFGESGIPIHQDARLRECDYGMLNGRAVERVSALRRQCIDQPFPGGESYRDAVERMRDFLDDVGPRFAGARVLVIGHSATRWALEHLLNGVPLEALVDAPFEWQEGWEYRFG